MSILYKYVRKLMSNVVINFMQNFYAFAKIRLLLSSSKIPSNRWKMPVILNSNKITIETLTFYKSEHNKLQP
jgi:hypothetical protein